MAKRRICVVTGSRAEYGLLYWLLKALKTDTRVALQLVVTGMHLSPRFGETWRAIEADGFEIAARVDMLEDGDGADTVIRSIARGLTGIAQNLNRLRPDIVVLLGDRFEIFAAAQASMITGLPVAHIHGGEITEGAMDDAFRHAITKMANLHFVSTETYRRRVIQLGELPERVFVVGAPALDNVLRLALLDRRATCGAVGLPDDAPFFLITFHPETLGSADPTAGIAAMLTALDRFPRHRFVFTGVNADPGHEVVADRIRNYVAAQDDRAVIVQSLGQLRYLSAMKHCDIVIGNSSSGLVEAPALCVPTVNIGNRQQGRIRTSSVIDCGEDADTITDAVNRALLPAFREELVGMENPYGDGGASERIRDILVSAPLNGLTLKRFHDLSTAGVT